jgi:phage regulator Rha-like protein
MIYDRKGCVRDNVWIHCVMTRHIRIAHSVGNRHTKKRQSISIGGGTTLNSFRNTVNMETPVTVTQKAQQFPRISTHFIMHQKVETGSAVTNFKMVSILNLDMFTWGTVNKTVK